MDEDYTSYDYLQGDLGLPLDPLAPEFDRVPAWAGGFTAEEVARAEALLAGNVTVSLHEHPVLFPADMSRALRYTRTGRQFTAFRGLAASGMTVVFDNMMDGEGYVTSTEPWQWDDVVIDLGMRQADLAHQSRVVVIRTLGDVAAAHREGRVGLVFGLESATPIGNVLDRIDVLYGLGVRQMGIAYTDANALGSGLGETPDGGLTRFGRAAVRRMNQLGMAIDISHAGEATGIQTCEASERPVLMTHAGARALWDLRRLKSDDALRAVAETGGVVGISAAPHTTISRAHPRHSIESVMDHFLYCVDLLGIDHVGFGPDTLYGDHVAMHRVYSQLPGAWPASGPEHETVAYVEGLENPTENFHNIAAWLVHHGFEDDDIVKVLGGNVIRALRDIWV